MSQKHGVVSECVTDQFIARSLKCFLSYGDSVLGFGIRLEKKCFHTPSESECLVHK